MNPTPSPIENAPAPDRIGVLLRVGLFVLIGWLGWLLFPIVIYPLAGIMVTSALSGFAAAGVANTIAVRVYERGRLSDIGLGWRETSLREFLNGMGLGVAAVTVIVAAPFAVGLVRFERAPGVEHPWASFAFVSLVLLFGAAGEELLFHGYAFQLLVRSVGAFATLLPASVLFGLAHMGNQNVSTLGVLNTIGWGGLLGYAYLRTNALWLPIGLHYGWNFALPLFGANLSGFTMGVTGYALRWRIGDLWSGGAYGPEGGLLTTVIIVALVLVVRRITPDEQE